MGATILFRAHRAFGEQDTLAASNQISRSEIFSKATSRRKVYVIARISPSLGCHQPPVDRPIAVASMPKILALLVRVIGPVKPAGETLP